jgi:glycosyltransferase involved in cell wall biosynthesis
MQRLPISLVIITLNEERNIERCIASAPWVSDIVVLDSASHDRTRELAEKAGARVFDESFRGYRDQKQRAVELAKFNWVLSLDADEVLSPRLSAEIQSAFKSAEPQGEAFQIPRLSFHLGRWIKRGGWYPDYQVRLFHRDRAQWVGGHIHERVEAEHAGVMEAPILHYVFRDLAHQVETNNRYSTLGAADVFDSRPNVSGAWILWKMVSKPISKFVETYLLKLGFLDGIPGFIISVGAGYSIFLKYSKVWELKNREKISSARQVLPSQAEN